MTNIRISTKGNSNLLRPILINGLFSAEECDKIVENSLNKEKKETLNEEMQVKSIYLDLFSQENQILIKKIIQIVNEVNDNFYQFVITNLYEAIFLEYQKSGFMNWHRDLGKRNTGGSTRKLTLSVLLSAETDYEGGKLLFKPDHTFKESIGKGSVIIYPSYLLHAVEPLTAGVRRVLIASANGPHFR